MDPTSSSFWLSPASCLQWREWGCSGRLSFRLPSGHCPTWAAGIISALVVLKMLQTHINSLDKHLPHVCLQQCQCYSFLNGVIALMVTAPSFLWFRRKGQRNRCMVSKWWRACVGCLSSFPLLLMSANQWEMWLWQTLLCTKDLYLRLNGKFCKYRKSRLEDNFLQQFEIFFPLSQCRS